MFCAGEGVGGCGGYAGAEVGDEGVDDGGVEDGDAELYEVLGVHELPDLPGGEGAREGYGYEEGGVDGLGDGGGADVAEP